MAWPTPVANAITRLLAYIGTRYDAATNPYGLAGDGYKTNIPAALNDMGTVADAVGEVVGTIAAAQSTISLSWDAGTAAADPGAGKARATTATPAAGSYSLILSTTDAAGVDATAVLADLGASTSATKARARLVKVGDPSVYVDLQVSGVTVASGYRVVAVTAIGGPGGFAAGNAVALGWARTGDKGDAGGATLPAGSASAPGLSVTGDSNTGIAQIGGADSLSMVGGGKELVRASQSGLVVSPGRSIAEPEIELLGPNGTEDYIIKRKGDTGLLEVVGVQSGYSGFSFKVNNTVERFRIPNTGPLLVDGVPMGAGGLYSGTSSKSANYSIVSGDGGGVIKCTAAVTLALPAASGLPAGWWVTISNRSTGAVFIPPSGSDTIAGLAVPLVLRSGQDITIYRTGSSTYEVVGLSQSVTDSQSTWSAANKGSAITLSNNNMTATGSAGTGSVLGTIGASGGKRYVEFRIVAANSDCIVGMARSTMNLNNGVGVDANGWGYVADGRLLNNGSYTAYGSTVSDNGLVMVAVDIDAGKMWVGVNGVWLGSGDPVAGTNPSFTGVTGTVYPAFGDKGSLSTAATLIVSLASFSYSPPAGYTTFY